MLRFNFATRLMLAMMLIVTMVSLGIFAVTRRSLDSAWQEVFNARFLSQTASLANMQKARLDSIEARCRELAASETVIKALQSESAVLPDEIRTELTNLARVVQDSAASYEQPDSRPGPQGPRRNEPPDNGSASTTHPDGDRRRNPETPPPTGKPPGNLIPASTDAPGSTPPAGSGNRQGRGFSWVRPDSLDLALMDATGRILSLKSGPDPQADWLEANNVRSVPATQEVAYMAVKPGGRRGRFPMRQLREVIITPIREKDNGEVIGALVVGLPVSTYGESALYDLNRRGKPGELFTGLWIDDQLFSRSIPREAVEEAGKAIRQSLANSDTPADGVITYQGTPFQLLFRSLNPSASTPQAWQITLFSLAGLAGEKANVRSKIIGYSAAAFAAAMLLSWLLSRRLVHPVNALVEGTKRIRNGDYESRVPITTNDELAALATSFNEMAEGLKQRERYRDILFLTSDDEIARQLIETGFLGGERREITVLFCDIRDFTTTTRGMAPEAVIDLLNEHMTALTEIVHRHHGVVDKFVGDLIMAIFGAPTSHGDDAGNAAACALEMMSRRDELNQTSAHPPLLAGIGIASGEAVAGCMGSENRLNYTVLGEPVNLASRLCSAAGPREVIIDQKTVALLGARAQGRDLSPLSLKGFPEPVLPFHLTRLADDS